MNAMSARFCDFTLRRDSRSKKLKRIEFMQGCLCLPAIPRCADSAIVDLRH